MANINHSDHPQLPPCAESKKKENIFLCEYDVPILHFLYMYHTWKKANNK
jgi:hypothetical protein